MEKLKKQGKVDWKMRKFSKIAVCILSLVLVVACLAGCGSTAAGTEGSSGKKYNFVYQCAWAAGGGPFKYASELSEAIVSCSGGRVTMDCLATNSVVSTMDMLQAVSSGTVDCIQTCSTNFSDDSLGILSTIPVGMTYEEYLGWYLGGEGQEILNEVMGQFADNVVVFPCGLVDSEILYHSRVPITCLDDIKGLKIRGVSDWAAIQTELGASVVSMDGSECYEALSRGTIDACEYSSPATNWPAGLHEVAPYMTVPGIHNSSAAYLFIMNKNVWDGLDEQIQNIIKLSCTAMMAQNWAEDRVANAEAWAMYEELAEQGKLTINRLPDEDIALIKETAAAYYEKKCEENPLFARVYESQMAYIEATESWNAAVNTD